MVHWPSSPCSGRRWRTETSHFASATLALVARSAVVAAFAAVFAVAAVVVAVAAWPLLQLQLRSG